MDMDMDVKHDPSRILEQARKHLEALRQAGLSREALIALLEEDEEQSRQQQQQQQPIQLQAQQPQHQQQQPQHQPPPQGGIEAPTTQLSPSFAVPSYPFIPSHQVRSSVSSTASSGRESILSTATAHSSVSSIGASYGKSSTPSSSAEAKYWCTSCDKTFKRKFDWKRHEEEFHERWRKYPCPNCNQSFWGPNTFNQHHKSAHGCRTCPHSDAVVKYMMKRRAWGCGFCAAMHSKLEKHYEHVAAHFESGALKADWLHSNVIYGLLHQPAVLEAWRDLISRKQSKFNGHQPMFSWSLDNTGRQQGYVENETPGQLQDFLEFFDGSKDSADKIARCAWGYCHVVLKPKSTPSPTATEIMPQHGLPASPAPDLCSLSRQVTITSQSRGLRRVASTSIMPIGRQSSRRVASADFRDQMSGITVSTAMAPPIEPSNNPYQTFMVPSQPVPSQHISPQPLQTESMQMSHRPLSLNKALPPEPLLTSPMDVDFNMFGTQDDQMLKPPMMEDWQSLSSTLIEEQTMVGQHQHQHQHHHQHHHHQHHQPHNPGFPITWEELGQYGAEPELKM